MNRIGQLVPRQSLHWLNRCDHVARRAHFFGRLAKIIDLVAGDDKGARFRQFYAQLPVAAAHFHNIRLCLACRKKTLHVADRSKP